MYKIFSLFKTGSLKNLHPCAINYKTSLSDILVKDTTFLQGRLTDVYYKNGVDIVLDVHIDYNDSTGDVVYPLYRTTTRKWYDDAGINHNILNFDKTIKVKKYTVKQALEEGQRRRTNIVENLFRMASSLGYETEASARMRDKSSMIESYRVVGDTTIITDLTNATDLWLSDPYPLDITLTLKQVMIAQLTI